MAKKQVTLPQATNWLWGLSAAILLLIIFFIIFGITFNRTDKKIISNVKMLNAGFKKHQQWADANLTYVNSRIDSLGKEHQVTRGNVNYLYYRQDSLVKSQRKLNGWVWTIDKKIKKLSARVDTVAYSYSSRYSSSSVETNETNYVDAQDSNDDTGEED